MGAPHGALVVVVENAEQEAERLSRQSTLILPTQLSPEEAIRASRIDGALLFDQRGTCFGIGVILDGEAGDAGSRSRGARFNSAIRYIYSGLGRLAVVHSEDGHVDLLPRLRPPIRRSDVESDLARIRSPDAASVDQKVLREAAERIFRYADFLDIGDEDWKKLGPVARSRNRLARAAGLAPNSTRILRTCFRRSRRLGRQRVAHGRSGPPRDRHRTATRRGSRPGAGFHVRHVSHAMVNDTRF